MSLKEEFNKYPNLKDVFWPGANGIKYNITDPHPLISLILGDDAITTEVAIRTDKCVQLIKNVNNFWLDDKSKQIIEAKDYNNASASLGELRAYGELIWIFGGDISVGKYGNDFSVDINGLNVKIEVHTPQHRSTRYAMEHEVVETRWRKTTLSEIFPFGWPERFTDNVQGEAVSRLAGIKQSEHQFEQDAINILWVDLKDPSRWRLELGLEQFLPVSAFREEITSGAFWNAFYGKKDTYIFDSLSVNGLPSSIYKMEFNGRFWNDSLIDFVIADTRSSHIVFQNPNRGITIPNMLFQKLHCLFNFNLEISWLDWPAVGQLKPKIEMVLDQINNYKSAFDING